MGELEDNLRAFEEQLPRLLETAEGKYAVGIKGDKFTCWDTHNDAAKYGYLKYGISLFIVKPVKSIETPATFTRDIA